MADEKDDDFDPSLEIDTSVVTGLVPDEKPLVGPSP